MSRSSVVGVLSVALFVAGCDGQTSRRPWAPISPGPVPGPTTTVQVDGRVIDENDAPVVGAAVSMRLSSGSPAVAVTDDSGQFTTRAEVVLLSNERHAEVTVTKEGYDSTQTLVRVSPLPETQPVLRLLQTLTIRPQETRQTRIFEDAAACGLEYEFPCRRITVQSSSADRVELDVISAEGREDVGLVIGEVKYPFRFESKVPVIGGDVWIYAGRGQAVTVRALVRQ